VGDVHSETLRLQTTSHTVRETHLIVDNKNTHHSSVTAAG
jgi:hypothetical protein